MAKRATSVDLDCHSSTCIKADYCSSIETRHASTRVKKDYIERFEGKLSIFLAQNGN